MAVTDLRHAITSAVQGFANGPIEEASANLLRVLGYESRRTLGSSSFPSHFS